MQHTVALSFADGNTLFIKANHNDVLMDAALRHGITLPIDCREGVCGTCKGRCESGQYRLDYADEEALTPAEQNARFVLSCQTRVQSDGTYYYDFDASLCSSQPLQPMTAAITRLQPVSDDTVILGLQLHDHADTFRFLPGQYVNLQIPGTPHRRAYSLANAANPHNRLQLLIRLLPDGQMGKYLQHCQVGDQLQLTGPFGAFYLRQPQRPLYFLAGGTGLSAFLAMLDTLTAQTDAIEQPIRLYYGVNRPEDLCELERLQQYQHQLPDFEWYPIVSKPDSGWSGRSGYIPEHLPLSALRDTEFDMYLCGPPPMIDAVTQWCADHSLTSGKLYSEKFTAPQTAG